MKNNDENVLVCKSVRFFCNKDEDAFFEWIKKINCINKIFGVDRELYLYIGSGELPDQDLDDLIGLFYRYKIDISQLKRFLTDDNKNWFYDNKKAFWHKKVFGNGIKSK